MQGAGIGDKVVPAHNDDVPEGHMEFYPGYGEIEDAWDDDGEAWVAVRWDSGDREDLPEEDVRPLNDEERRTLLGERRRADWTDNLPNDAVESLIGEDATTPPVPVPGEQGIPAQEVMNADDPQADFDDAAPRTTFDLPGGGGKDYMDTQLERAQQYHNMARRLAAPPDGAPVPCPRLQDVHPVLGDDISDLGEMEIPVSAIRGSVIKDAWPSIDDDKAQDFLFMWHEQGNLDECGPLDVVKVGDGFWLLDGHHRFAVLREVDPEGTVLANVVERYPEEGDAMPENKKNAEGFVWEGDAPERQVQAGVMPEDLTIGDVLVHSATGKQFKLTDTPSDSPNGYWGYVDLNTGQEGPGWTDDELRKQLIRGNLRVAGKGDAVPVNFEDTEDEEDETEGRRHAALDPDWLHERNNDPYGTPGNHEFWSTVNWEDIGPFRVFEKDGRWYAHNRARNYWMKLQATDAASAREEVGAMGGGFDAWASRRTADAGNAALYLFQAAEIIEKGGSADDALAYLRKSPVVQELPVDADDIGFDIEYAIDTNEIPSNVPAEWLKERAEKLRSRHYASRIAAGVHRMPGGGVTAGPDFAEGCRVRDTGQGIEGRVRAVYDSAGLEFGTVAWKTGAVEEDVPLHNGEFEVLEGEDPEEEKEACTLAASFDDPGTRNDAYRHPRRKAMRTLLGPQVRKVAGPVNPRTRVVADTPGTFAVNQPVLIEQVAALGLDPVPGRVLAVHADGYYRVRTAEGVEDYPAEVLKPRG